MGDIKNPAIRQALKDFDGSRTPVLTQDKGVAPLRVRVTGVLSGTPALPAGGAFVLMSDALASRQPAVTPNVMLLNGPGIDTARATALASKMVPTAGTVIRSEILESLTGAPVQRGAVELFILALVTAAGLGLAVMLLQTAAGSAVRVPLTTDAASFLLPIAGLVLVAAVTLGIEIQARRGVVATLRRGE